MIQKICTLNLDMFGKYTTHSDYVLVQGDIGANVFVINLQYQKLPLNLTNTFTTITFRKADGNKVVGSPEITNVSEGIIRYMVGEQEVAFVGEVEATVEVYDNTANRLTSGMFTFEVREQLNDGTAVESTTDYPFLADLMSAGASELERVNAEDSRTDAELIRVNNEDTRNSSEALRVSQENTRKTSETARVGAESARVTAESTRNTQENTRKSNETARVSAEASRVTVETARVGAESTRASQEATRLTQETGRTGAEATRVTQENTRQTNETARGTAETSRSTAETARQTAETDRVSKESTRVSTEATRSSSEATRVSQESTRVTQETARVNAEGDATKGRVKAENLRVTAESGRVTAETGRTTAEGTRVSNESTRGTNETARISSESSRGTAETARVSAESTRATNETARGTAETGRVNVEATRVTAETARGTAEGLRVSQENTRKTSETARVSAESTRVTQETARQTNTGNAITNMNNAVDSTIIIYKSPVATYSSIATTYPSPVIGWRVETTDTKLVYRYNGTAWVNIADSGIGYTPEDVAKKGVANGYAPLDASSKVPLANLPSLDYIPMAQRGAVSGVATLGTDGKVPSAQLPPLDYAGSTHDHDLVYAKLTQVLTNVPAGAIFTDTIYTHPANHAPSIITQDASNRFTTDTEKATWNAKASTAVATTIANGLMSLGDKSKLDGVATGANNYTHPASHAISLITGLQTALDGKVDDSQVLTNVPAGALFTDTIYTHPTGAGNNHIPTAGVAGQFLKWSSSGVAVWANDNDTIYTHPASHPASIITQDASNRFVTDAQMLIWNTVEEAVPSFDYYRDMEAVNENMALLLPLTGGTMTGNIDFGTSLQGLTWTMNTDYAKIYFKNASDADADSYLAFETGDNGNEGFKWLQKSGATTTTQMVLNQGNLTVTGSITSGGTAVSLSGHTHSYAPTSHTHAYIPSTASSSSWGSYDITTAKGGYSGFHFTTGDTMFMVRDSDGLSGVMKSSSWVWYFDGAGALVTGTVPWDKLTGVPSYSLSSHTHSYVPVGGRAYPMRSDGGSLNFMWSGQGGQPTWLWGGGDGINMYVYNPSNFSVSYAGSAGNADTVDGYHANAFVGTSGAYISHGFYLHSSPASGKYLIFGNYISGSQGTEMSIVPNTSGGWCSLGISANPFFKGYSYGWTNSSDKNLKSEIVPFSKVEGYDMLRELKFYSYRYYKGSDEDKVLRWEHSLGIMAQDAPYEISSYAEDGTSENAIDLYSYASLLGIASQAMQDKIEQQEIRIETLENEIEELKVMVAGILATMA